MCLAMNATVRIGTMKNDDNQQMKPNKKSPRLPTRSSLGDFVAGMEEDF